MKAIIERAAACDAVNMRRDSMFDTIMTKYFGPDSRLRIVSTSDVPGGNSLVEPAAARYSPRRRPHLGNREDAFHWKPPAASS